VTARWGFPRTKVTLLKALRDLEDDGTVDRLPDGHREPDRFGIV
jgi:hypothetical protein